MKTNHKKALPNIIKLMIAFVAGMYFGHDAEESIMGFVDMLSHVVEEFGGVTVVGGLAIAFYEIKMRKRP